EKQDYYLEIISTEVRRLSRLVSTLLEISKMQSGDRKLTITRFNLSEKTRQILLSFEKKIDDKKIEIEFNNDSDIFVSADTDAIHQVLYNLTDNAVKFTPQGGTLSITVQKHEKKAIVSVRNTGEGIPAEELPYLFDRFYKSDRSRGLDKAGTGLGLYIVKSTLNMHGEDITVASIQGQYTEFKFTLPIA
ncbi:MAG: HAMP domain-containing sensor histidine kinase, partial [Clostridia bacterium]